MRFVRIGLSVLFLAVLVIGAASVSPAMAAVGTISISPTSGPPGTGVAVTGGGFTAGSGYTVLFGTLAVATGNITSGGNLPAVYITAPSVGRALYNVSVTTSAGDTSNAASFSITPQITIDYSSGRVGDTIKVSGTGFAANSSVNLVFESTSVTTASSDPSGTFTNVAVTIPPATPGRHNITANDSLAYAPQVVFTVLPRLTYTPNVQTVGSQITLAGSGFVANSPVSFFIDNVNVVTNPAVTDASGSFSGSTMTVPPLSNGTHVLAAQDTQANAATANLYIRPGISLAQVSGSPGSIVQVKGSGFTASASITLTYSGHAVATNPTPLLGDSGGSFTASFTVPTVPSGSYTVVASDGTNTASGSFTIAAGANLNPTTGPAGVTVTVTGTNFLASVPIIITYDGGQVGTASSDAAGSFSTTFKSPNSRGGGHIINVMDGTNTLSLTFVTTPTVSVSPTSGTVDSNVNVSGAGFTASKAVNVTFDRIQVGSVVADANGAFAGPLKVPASASGSHQISASDGGSAVNASFTVQSTANITPANGGVGRSVTVKGSGFAAGKPVSATFDRAQVATGTADANGSIGVAFDAPPASTGGHQVIVTDGSNSANLTFSITPAMGINPTLGVVGTNVAVSGNGFAPSKALGIKYDNGQVAQPTTDASGSFVGTFSAPVSLGGKHVVSVTDGVSTLTADFNMDQTPPPAPEAVLPADAIKASATPQFNWSAVNDPSGVTYTLQIASDSTFSNIVLEKKDLATPGYTLSDTEKLKSTGKDKPYYWRTRAVDAASNVGPWSTPRSFYVGFVAGAWVTYVVFAVIALAIGVFGFWLGRRTYPF